MTEPNPIVETRKRLGLSVIEWSDLLGISQSTAYRWETGGYDLSKIDPFQRRLLLLIEDLRTNNDVDLLELGTGLRTALLRGGTLFGVYHLLRHVYAEEAS